MRYLSFKELKQRVPLGRTTGLGRLRRPGSKTRSKNGSRNVPLPDSALQTRGLHPQECL